MKDVVLILGLLAGAYALTALLSRGERGRFGILAGSEYFLLGVAIGPQAIGLLTRTFVEGAAPAIVAGCAWLAFLHGLRIRRSQLSVISGRARVLWLAEPLLSAALVIALASFFFGARGVDRQTLLVWSLVAASSSTSALAWFQKRAVTGDARYAILRSTAQLGGIPTLILFGVVPLWVAPSRELALLIVGGSGLAIVFALLVTFLLGRGQLDPDFTWVAIIGVLSLSTGLCLRANLPVVSIAAIMGVALGSMSHHADGIEQLLAETEKPVTVTLLILLGTAIVFTPPTVFIGAALALLRVIAKLIAGTLLRTRGLVAAGEAGVLIAASLVLSSEDSVRQTIAAALGFSLIAGDLLSTRGFARVPHTNARDNA